jgi:hypothetical protein
MRSSFACLITDLDVRPLLTALEAKPDLWDQITERQTTPGSPHVDTRAIFLRWATARTIEAVFNDIDAIDYPAYDELPEFRELVGQICEINSTTKLARVMITKLKPGGRITPHADEGLYADTYERFHLVLQSDVGNKFMSQSKKSQFVYETAEMRVGELWWFDHKRTHWVENNSNRDRIHLIMDMAVPFYRVEREQ